MSHRFPIKEEIPRIAKAFKGQEEDIGTSVLWYSHQPDEREMHPVYGEAYSGGGASFAGPFRIPILWVDPVEGPRVGQEGFYSTDTIRFAFSSTWLRRYNIKAEEVREHLRDRVVYGNIVFKLDSLMVRGLIRDHNVVVGVQASEADPDELVNDPVFHIYTNDDSAKPIPPGV